jgi:molybdate transport system substrate-binding protein
MRKSKKRMGKSKKDSKGCSYLVIILLSAAFLTGCGKKTEPVELLIGAAASLKPVLEELQTIYQDEKPEVKLNFTFASSGTLEQQIREGAPIDVFIGAAAKQMDSLEKDELLVEGTRVILTKNEIVLIVPKGNRSSISGFEDAIEASVIALGNPSSVPVGQYAQEVFEGLGNWKKIEVIASYSKDVTEVLAWVSSGNADAGVVYATDTVGTDEVEVLAIAPRDSHSPIVYPAAIIKGTKQEVEARDFIVFLRSQESTELFEEYGFQPIQ